jgi:hypothetical protein
MYVVADVRIRQRVPITIVDFTRFLELEVERILQSPSFSLNRESRVLRQAAACPGGRVYRGERIIPLGFEVRSRPTVEIPRDAYAAGYVLTYEARLYGWVPEPGDLVEAQVYYIGSTYSRATAFGRRDVIIPHSAFAELEGRQVAATPMGLYVSERGGYRRVLSAPSSLVVVVQEAEFDGQWRIVAEPRRRAEGCLGLERKCYIYSQGTVRPC